MRWRIIFGPSVIASCLGGWRSRKGPPPASSSPIPPRRSPPKARYWPSAQARRTKPARFAPLDVKVGDRVLFGKWSGTEVIIDGEDRLIMRESDVFGVIEGGAHSSARAA